MSDITLSDLISWEPRLRLIGPDGQPSTIDAGERLAERWSDREVSWAVTARASTPMLPLLRGGELVILPARALGDSGVSLPILLRELAALDAAGVVLDTAPGHLPAIPALFADSLPADFETDINRLLTQRRGELYRAGTDLGRQLSNMNVTGAAVEDILAAASLSLGVPVGLTDARGATIAATSVAAVPTDPQPGARGWRADRLASSLPTGETLWFGPVPVAQRALCRVASEPLAVTVESALVRAAQTRPRGAARAAAIADLLVASGGDVSRAAMAAGLPADGAFRVALVGAGFDPAVAHRLLATGATLHDAGHVDGYTAFVLETRSEQPPARPSLSARIASPGGEPSTAWLAVSSATSGSGHLAALAREARYVARLLTQGSISGPIARFDVIDDIGAYQALYPLWGSPALQRFATSALGDLPSHDKRGTLRETLLAFLECGGSHVDTAQMLDIHRNTLAYRLKQIADLTRLDPLEPTVRLTLHLALLATRLPISP